MVVPHQCEALAERVGVSPPSATSMRPVSRSSARIAASVVASTARSAATAWLADVVPGDEILTIDGLRAEYDDGRPLNSATQVPLAELDALTAQVFPEQ